MLQTIGEKNIAYVKEQAHLELFEQATFPFMSVDYTQIKRNIRDRLSSGLFTIWQGAKGEIDSIIDGAMLTYVK